MSGWEPPGPVPQQPPDGWAPPGPGGPAYPPAPPQPHPGHPYPHQAYPQQAYPGQWPPPRELPAAGSAPLEYHQLHRAGRQGWWWGLTGVLALVATYFAVLLVVGTLFLLGVVAATGRDPQLLADQLQDTSHPTPLMLTFVNLTLAVAIPVTWFVQRVFHDLKPRWLSSVRSRLRWSYLLICLPLSILALGAALVAGMVLPASGGSGEATELNAFTSTTRDYLLVVLLLTPFQAAGEEYFFRGYLTQALGGMFARVPLAVSRAIAVLVPAVLFALVHGSQSVPVFFDRFAFGVVAGVLVIVTGGLEAGIAMHVLNNFLAFGLALAFGDMATALNPPAGSWWDMIPTLAQSLAYLGLVLLVSRRMGWQTRSDPAVLAASRGLVYRVPSVQPPPPAL